MFWAPLCPSSGVQGCTQLHMVFSTESAGRSLGTPGGRSEAGLVHCVEPLHSAHDLPPRVPKPYAVVYSLALQKMGTMVPKTC